MSNIILSHKRTSRNRAGEWIWLITKCTFQSIKRKFRGKMKRERGGGVRKGNHFCCGVDGLDPSTAHAKTCCCQFRHFGRRVDLHYRENEPCRNLTNMLVFSFKQTECCYCLDPPPERHNLGCSMPLTPRHVPRPTTNEEFLH